jgi:hypothetical protein
VSMKQHQELALSWEIGEIGGTANLEIPIGVLPNSQWAFCSARSPKSNFITIWETWIASTRFSRFLKVRTG